MSKLLEKLERASEGRAQPLGFGAGSSREKTLPMVVLASATLDHAHLLAAAADGGADALLIIAEQPSSDKALAQLRKAKPAIPWGVRFGSLAREDMAKLIDMGCDFVVFHPERASASVLTEDRIGKVLDIDPSLSDNLVKAAARLSVDAVLLSPLGEGRTPLTVRQLMELERLAAGAGKYVLTSLPPSLPVEGIEALWSIGVRGVVVDLTAVDPGERLAQVREAISRLPARKKKPKDKLAARLPSLSGLATGRPPGEEEEEPEEEP